MPKTFIAQSGDYNYNYHSRELSQTELKTDGEIAVWWEYKRLKQLSVPNVALAELLRRHENMLQSLARASQSKYSYTSEYEDKLQHARYGAMRAYEKFDLEKAIECGTRLSTYVQATVHRHLLSANDVDEFINCPPVRRMLRSYLWGRYDSDPKKLVEVEKRLGVNTSDDKAELYQKYGTLLASYAQLESPASESTRMNGAFPNQDTLMYEDILQHQGPSADDLLHKLQLENHISKLSQRQQSVLVQFSQGIKMNDIAQSLNITEDMVRGDIRTIRVIMKRELSADKKEEAILLKI